MQMGQTREEVEAKCKRLAVPSPNPNKVDSYADLGTQKRDERSSPGMTTSNATAINTPSFFLPVLQATLFAAKNGRKCPGESESPNP